MLLACFLAIFTAVLAQDSPCCSQATGSCRTACQQMSLVTTAGDPDALAQKVDQVRNFCPQQLVGFWECLNRTLEDVGRGETWSGRACCPLPQSEACRVACLTATSRLHLAASCRLSDEIAFFSCLDRAQAGDGCCGGARSGACQAACRAVFRSQLTPPRELRDQVERACSSDQVLQCVANFTRLTPAPNSHKFLHCCEKTNQPACGDTCRKILRTRTTGQEILDGLAQGGCGPVLPQDQFWQCFLQSSQTPPMEKWVKDSAKLHCCAKATRPMCRRLCLKTFSNEWNRFWLDFNNECLQQLTEESLVHCIDEVEEPCELGCEGLGYCTNFNNRPTELFRSCSKQADSAARYDIALWQSQGFLELPGLRLYVRNISQCQPATWKAVACVQQVKPCHENTHTNRICREDCHHLLSQCLDWKRMPEDESVASLCGRLSPEDDSSPCVSLKKYLEPSTAPYQEPHKGVTLPCKGDHPCNSTEVCLVNRNCATGQSCQSYMCVPGCKLGEVSPYMVPQGTYVRIPFSGIKDCQKVCQCTAQGTLEHCENLPCVHTENCWVGNKKIDHNAWFYMDCNLCSCYQREISCSKRHCDDTDPAYTSLPCNCPPHYVPVCTRTGNTYPSACLAKCAGFSDAEYEFGPCSSKDPCERVNCPRGFQCIPDRKICIFGTYKTCPQHRCVNITDHCFSKSYEPVCDTTGQQHSSLCHLLRYGKKLAYYGSCRTNCKNEGPVCGTNGVMYQSECAAFADGVSVDYTGPCIAVGRIGDRPTPQCLESAVECAPLAQSDCFGITPPGACCPVCAGAIRFLFSQRQLERALAATGKSISVKDVIESLQRHVQIAECSVRGQLTIESDLLALVQVNTDSPSSLQLEACIREAEKLASIVQSRSPRVTSELSLGMLTAASVVHISATDASALLAPSILPMIVTVVCLKLSSV